MHHSEIVRYPGLPLTWVSPNFEPCPAVPTRSQIPTKGNDIPPYAVPLHRGPNGQLYIARGLLGVFHFFDHDLSGMLMCRVS